MKLLTLNLRHGGGQRINRLADYFVESGADLIVATEYRHGRSGAALKERMAGAGYAFSGPDLSSTDGNAVCIFTLRPILSEGPVFVQPWAHRGWRIRVAGLSLTGVYLPTGSRKLPLFDTLLSMDWPDDGVVIGDWNTGLHRLDEAGATFVGAHRFAALSEAGLVDLWRHRSGPVAREQSWLSPAGNGFRLDHAFGTAPMANRVRSITYDHATRPTLTDHSALILHLD